MRKNIIVLIILTLLITACELSWVEDIEVEDVIAPADRPIRGGLA